jgi:hypothetical protein
MGHKGVSIRKLPKAKQKPLATIDHNGGLVSSLNQSPESAGRAWTDKNKLMPPGNGNLNPCSGSKKKHKSH